MAHRSNPVNQMGPLMESDYAGLALTRCRKTRLATLYQKPERTCLVAELQVQQYTLCWKDQQFAVSLGAKLKRMNEQIMTACTAASCRQQEYK
jgi:hypothetical protein